MPKLAGKAVPLAERIDGLTSEGDLYERLEDNKLRCYACGHRCLILEGQRGICQVRFNRDGVLMVPRSYVGALQCDPTEKKPFFHVLPGSNALTFGMLGCDYHCSYSQTWLTSQAPRDTGAALEPEELRAERLVALARERAPAGYSPTLGGRGWGEKAGMNNAGGGQAEHHRAQNGRLYLVPSKKRLSMFEANPGKYAAADVALNGYCSVCKVEQGKDVKGKAEFAATYDGKRYLFPGSKQLEMFKSNPAKYAVN